MTQIRVGEVAKRTGLTVRTLHHWEQYGLFRPADRTEAGHRLYGPAELRRVLQIASLRQLGLGLDEIQVLLVDEAQSPVETLVRHIAQLKDEILRATELKARLVLIVTALEQQTSVSSDDLLRTVEMISMYDKYYTEAQLAELDARGESLGDEAIADVQRQWQVLFDDVRTAIAAGVAPQSDRAKTLRGRWDALIAAFTGGNESIRQSLENMYQSEPTARQAWGPDPDLWAFIRQIEV